MDWGNPEPLRYVVLAPVPGGDAWWYVADTFTREQGNPMGQNFAVAEIFRDMPNAEQEARALCDRLNTNFVAFLPPERR